MVGTTSAWYLSQAGHEVTVVERREAPGLETSYANGGQISAGHAEPWAKPSAIPQMLRWLGREDAPLLFRLRADPAQWAWGLRFLAECWPGRFEQHCRVLAGLGAYSRECLRELRRQAGIHYDELSKGILHFATTRRDFDALAEHVEAMRGLGLRREVKSAEQCFELEPALKSSAEPVVGGIYTPDDESGDAHKFTTELARRAEANGVHFQTGRTIRRLHGAGGAVQSLELDNGKLQADAYVIALGSYSAPMLAPLGIRIPVYPLKGYSITLPLSAAEASAAPSVSLTDEAYKIVISRLGNRLRAAGTAELTGYDTSINAVRCGAILRRVRQLFPHLSPTTEVENWAGLRPATPNNVPLIGRTRLKNLFLNTGHGTLGWTLSCGSARALSDLISGRKPEVEFSFLG